MAEWIPTRAARENEIDCFGQSYERTAPECRRCLVAQKCAIVTAAELLTLTTAIPEVRTPREKKFKQPTGDDHKLEGGFVIGGAAHWCYKIIMARDEKSFRYEDIHSNIVTALRENNLKVERLDWTVRRVLSRMTANGHLRRLARDVYQKASPEAPPSSPPPQDT